MNENTPDAGSKGIARRRLIRGAFATPAVFTLCSGGALAQSSAALRCIAQANSPATAAPGVITDPSIDTWVRVQLVQTGSPPKYYVLGTSLPENRLPALPADGEWQEFDIKTTGTNANSLKGSREVIPSGTSYADAQQYAALRINSSGVVVDVGNSSSASGSPVGTSCYTSFITAA